MSSCALVGIFRLLFFLYLTNYTIDHENVDLQWGTVQQAVLVKAVQQRKDSSAIEQFSTAGGGPVMVSAM